MLGSPDYPDFGNPDEETEIEKETYPELHQGTFLKCIIRREVHKMISEYWTLVYLFPYKNTIQTKILFIDTQSYLKYNGGLRNMIGEMTIKKSR